MIRVSGSGFAEHTACTKSLEGSILLLGPSVLKETPLQSLSGGSASNSHEKGRIFFGLAGMQTSSGVEEAGVVGGVEGGRKEGRNDGVMLDLLRSHEWVSPISPLFDHRCTCMYIQDAFRTCFNISTHPHIDGQ